jgi:hypothetical protein
VPTRSLRPELETVTRITDKFRLCTRTAIIEPPWSVFDRGRHKKINSLERFLYLALRFECFQRNLSDNLFYHSSQSHGIAYYFIISLRVEVYLFVLSPEIDDRNAVGRAAAPLMQILFLKESNYLNPPSPGGTAILPEYIHYYGYYYQVIVQCLST